MNEVDIKLDTIFKLSSGAYTMESFQEKNQKGGFSSHY